MELLSQWLPGLKQKTTTSTPLSHILCRLYLVLTDGKETVPRLIARKDVESSLGVS